MTTNLPFSQACENNKAPILEKLRELFKAPGKVLEVGTILPMMELDAGTAHWPVGLLTRSAHFFTFAAFQTSHNHTSTYRKPNRL
ncbi:DUF938 domain-containing protein [Marinobacter changyiensis]|uniref:DUF938 domain-containing protein n=1 Tax=Marinobacter changyiensis TaxID=2604091 RepID=UPI001FE9046C|nr:DUF938 domain-containing protein [Marinobacter changyiensis]